MPWQVCSQSLHLGFPHKAKTLSISLRDSMESEHKDVLLSTPSVWPMPFLPLRALEATRTIPLFRTEVKFCRNLMKLCSEMWEPRTTHYLSSQFTTCGATSQKKKKKIQMGIKGSKDDFIIAGPAPNSPMNRFLKNLGGDTCKKSPPPFNIHPFSI